MKRVVIILLLFSCLDACLFAQRDELHVLTYKFKVGDAMRVQTSTYGNFSTVSPVYNNSTYGETDFDLIQTIAATDEEGSCTMDVQVELTKKTVNGQNLTYKMAKLFNGDHFELGVDRFGTMLDKAVDYTADSLKPLFVEGTKSVRSFFLLLPDYPVKINDRWRPEEFGDTLAQALVWAKDFHINDPTITAYYKLESVDQGIAKIGLSLEIGGKGQIGADRTTLSMEYAIVTTGSYFFDIRAGRIINATVETRIAGIGNLRSSNIDFSGSVTTSFNVESVK